MTIGNQIKRARAARGLTQQQLADHLKINRVSVAQWEGRGNSPEMGKLPKIADFLRVPVDWLLSEDIDVPPDTNAAPVSAEELAARPRRKGQSVTGIIPQDQVQGAKYGPVYSGAQGGDGKLIITFDEIDRVRLPPFLENVPGAYGLLIDGESMVPAFEPGDIALINPHLRPQRGRNVILYHTPPRGEEAEAIIKRLNGWTDREWDLEQWNPHENFKVYRQEWPVCHRVVGKYDAT